MSPIDRWREIEKLVPPEFGDDWIKSNPYRSNPDAESRIRFKGTSGEKLYFVIQFEDSEPDEANPTYRYPGTGYIQATGSEQGFVLSWPFESQVSGTWCSCFLYTVSVFDYDTDEQLAVYSRGFVAVTNAN